MSDSTLLNDFARVSSQNVEYQRNRDRWLFLLDSFVGGQQYKNGNYLTKYQLETEPEYQGRIRTTPLDNHCQSVISVYISYLFRECPKRDFGVWEAYSDVEDFLDDADLEGRDLDSFMKDVSTWSSVFGACWVLMTKPNLGANTAGEEVAMGVRPYINLLTPLAVLDWAWTRQANGYYELTYFKYVEEIVNGLTIVKEWTKEEIRTWAMDDTARKAVITELEVNQLGVIPAVLAYNKRSIVKGIGVSDISDIADIQRQIYNLNSEIEQSHRLDGHPSLVVTPDTQYGSGAGAVIVMPENSDPGLKPYVLEHGGANVSSMHDTINLMVQSVDRMANTGGVRTTAVRTLSGVAMEVEFGLLNARLSEKADAMELAEEQLWKLYGLYQGREWTGEVEYPGSFNVRDTQREFAQLLQAKQAATDPRVLQVIDHELIELLGEDADLIMPEMATLADGSTVPYDSAEPFEEPEELYNPATGESGWVIDFAAKREAMLNGWLEKE
jgi:hypothetical protein